MAKLTVAGITAQVKRGTPKLLSDGGNLYLRMTGSGVAKWSLRYMRQGRARELGLGAYDPQGIDGRTLAEAREAAQEARRKLREGIDPIDHKRDAAVTRVREEAAGKTFDDVAEALIESQEAGWKNAKHRAQWRSTLATYASPLIGKMRVSEIGTEDVLRVLQPIWTSKAETASRLRGRVEAVLAYAAARGWRTGENPARWRGYLDRLLPATSKVARVVHHVALFWPEIGSFVATLRTHQSTAARALEFAILTATHTGEVLGARWSEIDEVGAVWVIPASRMKMGREHRVPLSDRALELLAEMRPLRPEEGDGYVFPGQKRGKPLSQMAMLMLLRRMKRDDLTVHGFRSTFRDWVEEETSTPHAVAEAALAHTIGNKSEAAYRRGDLFRKRALLMQEWADYCYSAAEAEDEGAPLSRTG